MKCVFKKSIFLAAAATIAMAVPVLAAPTCTLSIVTTPGVDLNGDPLSNGGSWTVYFQDSLNDNAGLADYVIDVVGSNGINVTSSQRDTAVNISTGVTRKVGTKTQTFRSGFGFLGSDGTNGNIIADFQGVPYGPESNSTLDTLVYQGVGQIPSSSSAQAVADGVSWGVPADLASGTYSGNSGDLTVYVPASYSIQYLIGNPLTTGDSHTPNPGGTGIGGPGTWKGPFNVWSFDNVQPYTAVVSSVPEPAIGALGIGSLALMARRRSK